MRWVMRKGEANGSASPPAHPAAFLLSSPFCSCTVTKRLIVTGAVMSKRIAISCPDHIHAVLSGLSELQSRPMSRIIVELLEASYPALNSVYMTLVRLEAEKRLANDSMATDVGAVVDDFKSSVEELIAEVQLELEGLQPPYGNTGATYSSDNSKTPPKRSVTPKLRGV